MIKRQYNNDIFFVSDFIVSVQRLGYTPAGKNRYRVGIIAPYRKYYPHEIVYTTTSHESEKAEAERVVAFYLESITRGGSEK